MALTDGIRAIWHMNNSDADASGRGNTLVRTGAVYSAAQVKLGSHALYCDGVDDRAVSNNADFRFDWNNPFSVAFWIKKGSDYAAIIGNLDPGLSYRGWEISLNAGKIDFQLINSSAAYKAYKQSTAVLTTNYGFGVCTYNGSGLASGMKIYVNAVEGSSSIIDTLGGRPVVNARDLFIGNRIALNYGYNGYLDEIPIWGREISASEVTTLYNAGAGMELSMPAAGSRGMRSFERGIFSGGA